MGKEIDCTIASGNRDVARCKGELSYNAKEMNMPEFVFSEVEVLDETFAPVGIAYPRKGFDVVAAANRWFQKRLVSDKRKDIPRRNEMAATWINSQGNNAQVPHFFSFTDQYWLRFDKTEDWERLNFFDNDFNPITGEVFLSLNQRALKELKYVMNSPDITTPGIQPKRWRREKTKDGAEIYLYKAQRNPSDKSVFAEVMASKVLKQMNCIPFVTYELDISDYQMCTRCKCFIGGDEELVPASQIYHSIPEEEGEDRFAHLITAAEQFEIPGVIEFVDMMIEVDRKLLNFDRHLGNFGFIRNINTGKFKGPAPLYDFGNAYLLTEEQERLLEEMKLNHYFKNRERKLIREKKIGVNNSFDKNMFLEAAEGLPIDGLNEVIEKIEADINLSDNHIVGLSKENDKDKKHDKGHDKKKDKDRDNMPDYSNF